MMMSVAMKVVKMTESIWLYPFGTSPKSSLTLTSQTLKTLYEIACLQSLKWTATNIAVELKGGLKCPNYLFSP